MSDAADAVRPTPPAPDWRRPALSVIAECVIGAVLTVTLVGYMLLGNYTRYVADDYGTAIAVSLRGFWAQQVAAYRLTDGHFVATALQTALSYVNPVVVRVLPGILIILWVAALTLALRHLMPNAGPLGRLVIAEAMVYTILRVTPSPFLALYWMTASVAFVVPLIIAAVVVWLITRPGARGRRDAVLLVVIGILAFIASGEAEIYTVAAFIAWTLALVVAVSSISPVWRTKLPRLVAAWIGATAGLAVELASPGNALRSAAISKIVAVPRPSFIALPVFTAGRVVQFAQILVSQHVRAMLTLALLVALIAAWSGAAPKVVTRSGLIAAVLATVGTAIVVWAAMTPAALEYGSLPPLYDQIVLIFACVCGTVTLGWLAGRVIRYQVDAVWPRLKVRHEVRALGAAGAAIIVAAIVVIGPVAMLATMRQDLPAYEDYAAGKDAQTAAAEAADAAGRSSVIVPALVNVANIGVLSHTPYEELTTDPTYWINEDTAEYYGIRNMAVSH
jgi:hypothetical protein